MNEELKVFEGIVIDRGGMFKENQEVDAFSFTLMSFDPDFDGTTCCTPMGKHEVIEYGKHAHTSNKVLEKYSRCKVVGKSEDVVVVDEEGNEHIVNRIYAKSVDYLK